MYYMFTIIYWITCLWNMLKIDLNKKPDKIHHITKFGKSLFMYHRRCMNRVISVVCSTHKLWIIVGRCLISFSRMPMWPEHNGSLLPGRPVTCMVDVQMVENIQLIWETFWLTQCHKNHHYIIKPHNYATNAHMHLIYSFLFILIDKASMITLC